jgi:hypothetical protein
MNIKEQINELLQKVGLKAEEVIKLEQVTLDDNVSVIEAEVFEVGQMVNIVNEDERIPLPVGVYTFDDGRVLTVTEEGIIGAIEMPTEETEEEPAEEIAQADAPAVKPVEKKIVETVSKETYFSLEEEKNKLKAENEAMKMELTELKKIKFNPEPKIETEEPIMLGHVSPKMQEIFKLINK